MDDPSLNSHTTLFYSNSVPPPVLTDHRPWSPSDWTSSDDRVRGGASQSYLDCDPSSPAACFRGHLDITVLGGAGFASQRTTDSALPHASQAWDLRKYDGLELEVEPKKSDGKRYTLTVKDEVLPRREDGREQSTISWEYDFIVDGVNDVNMRYEKGSKKFVAWKDLKPTYRGREKEDAEPLNLGGVKRISLMARSFFGDQEGDFELCLTSIAAVKKQDSSQSPYRDEEEVRRSMEGIDEKGHAGPQSWMSWLFGVCGAS